MITSGVSDLRWRTALLALALALRLSSPGPVHAQCTAGPLTAFAPPGDPEGYGPLYKFKAGFATSMALLENQGSRQLLLRENYGYTLYDLSDLAAPGSPSFCDIEIVTGYRKSGDGHSTVFNVAASPDGTRILVGYLEPHGNLLMARGILGMPGCVFNFAGEFPPNRASGDAVAPLGSRYLAFATYAANVAAPVRVADVTSYLTGAAAQQPNSLPSEGLGGVPGSVGESGFVRGTSFISHGLAQVVVVDFANAGPAGAIVPGLTPHVFAPADLGLPAGSNVGNVAAEIHPLSGELLLLVEALDSTTNQPAGVSLVALRGGSPVVVGEHLAPPAGWVGSGAMTAVATESDVLFFAWRNDRATPLTHKLFTWSAARWGTDLTPAALFPTTTHPTLSQAWSTKALRTAGGALHLYLAAGNGAFALPLSCTETPRPTASVSGSATICAGGSATIAAALTGTPPFTLTWSDGAVQAGVAASPATRVVSPGSTTSYTVITVTDAAGGSGAGDGAALITVATPPAPAIVSPASVITAVSGNAASVASTDGSSYAWSVENGAIVAGQGTSQIAFQAGTEGTLFLHVVETNVHGCSSPTATASVPVDAAPAPLGFHPVTPCRLLDTRNSSGDDAAAPFLEAYETRTFDLAGRCGIPATARSLAVNVTTLGGDVDGSVTLVRGDLASPLAFAGAIMAGKARASMSTVELARDASAEIRVRNGSAAPIHFLLDVSGYFE